MRVCTIDGCNDRHTAKGLCSSHYQEFRRTEKSPFRRRLGRKRNNKPCKVEGCVSIGKTRGYCSAHYQQFRRHGEQLNPARRKRGTGGERNGYIVRWLNGGQVLEHRIVMQGILGRPLLRNENVHHRNGIRNDNRPENLELWTSWQPSGQRVEDKVMWAIEMLKLYSPEVLR